MTPSVPHGDCPWYISARAVRDLAAVKGQRPPRDDSSEWDALELELIGMAIECVAKKTPVRVDDPGSGLHGLLRYRWRPRGGLLDVKLYVSSALRDEGPLPQLVHVAPGSARGKGR